MCIFEQELGNKWSMTDSKNYAEFYLNEGTIPKAVLSEWKHNSYQRVALIRQSIIILALLNIFFMDIEEITLM